MKTQFYRQRNVFRAKYNHNTVIHLIIACAVAYVLLQALNIILLILADDHQSMFESFLLPNIGLQPFHAFLHKPWTLFTYFWLHASFLYMLSNMLWLYCFGSVIQSFVGYREIFPMFILSSIVSGVGYLFVSYFWAAMPDLALMTALPGVMAFAVGAFIMVPRYRFYLTEHFSVPIWLVLALFLMLNVMTTVNNYALMILLGFAALSGAAYIGLLKKGYHPGGYLYRWGKGIQALVTPVDSLSTRNIKRKQTLNISKHQVLEHPSQEYVDFLLDKINQKGYRSLTSEEKETLMNASKPK